LKTSVVCADLFRGAIRRRNTLYAAAECPVAYEARRAILRILARGEGDTSTPKTIVRGRTVLGDQALDADRRNGIAPALADHGAIAVTAARNTASTLTARIDRKSTRPSSGANAEEVALVAAAPERQRR
jgi:hypothetical protein